MIHLLGILCVWFLSVAFAVFGVAMWIDNSPWICLLLLACSFFVMLGGLYALAVTALGEGVRR